MTKVRRGRVTLPALLLSLVVRAAKYAGLYCLFLAVTRPNGGWTELSHAPVAAVLVALIAAEGAASLPVPTFLSFGAYEAGGSLALVALGFPPGASLTVMLAMHLLSQIVDYSLNRHADDPEYEWSASLLITITESGVFTVEAVWPEWVANSIVTDATYGFRVIVE